MIRPKANANWWQYSKWMHNIGRSLRVNPPSSTERTAVELFIQQMANPDTGTRTWLAQDLRLLLVKLIDGSEPISPRQPDFNESKMIMVIGRDLMKIPLTEEEKPYCDALITATGCRIHRKDNVNYYCQSSSSSSICLKYYSQGDVYVGGLENITGWDKELYPRLKISNVHGLQIDGIDNNNNEVMLGYVSGVGPIGAVFDIEEDDNSGLGGTLTIIALNGLGDTQYVSIVPCDYSSSSQSTSSSFSLSSSLSQSSSSSNSSSSSSLSSSLSNSSSSNSNSISLSSESISSVSAIGNPGEVTMIISGMPEGEANWNGLGNGVHGLNGTETLTAQQHKWKFGNDSSTLSFRAYTQGGSSVMTLRYGNSSDYHSEYFTPITTPLSIKDRLFTFDTIRGVTFTWSKGVDWDRGNM